MWSLGPLDMLVLFVAEMFCMGCYGSVSAARHAGFQNLGYPDLPKPLSQGMFLES